jgi:prepilin-type N-terminal cleavage/methylation domain-containing protein
MRRAGLTLVELLIAVTILSVGIVFIFRSFSGSLRAIGTGEMRTAAWEFLSAEASATEIAQRAGGDLSPGYEQRTVDLASRKAEYRVDVSCIDNLTDAQGYSSFNTTASTDTSRLCRVLRTLNWTEQSRSDGVSFERLYFLPGKR